MQKERLNVRTGTHTLPTNEDTTNMSVFAYNVDSGLNEFVDAHTRN